MRLERGCVEIVRTVVGVAISSVFLFVTLAMPAAAEDDAGAKSSQKKLTIQSPVSFKDGLEVREAVKAECSLRTRLPGYILEFAERHADVTLAEDIGQAKGRTLRVVIEEVRESGTIGPKSVTVQGELRDGGKVIGTIEARRSSMGGPFGAFGGACGILHRCLKALGKDLSGWIEKPAMNVEMLN